MKLNSKRLYLKGKFLGQAETVLYEQEASGNFLFKVCLGGGYLQRKTAVLWGGLRKQVHTGDGDWGGAVR